jgi:hypothetical protein
VLTLRQIIQSVRLALAAGVLAVAWLAVLWPAAAAAQGKLEAHYTVTLAGIPIGKGDWTIDIADTHYSASVTGTTTGLMRVLTEGEGSTVARGTLAAGKVQSSTYVAIVKSRKKKDEVRVTLDKGSVKDTSSDPPPDHDRERVPVTEADLQNVFDPMSATLLTVPGNGNPLAAEACQRTMPIFDGRLRYDLQLTFKRMDNVKAEKGYGGPVVVCAVTFKPIAGYIGSRATIRYLAKIRDMEIWLAPIAGTRVLVPFRAQGPTPIGEAVMLATQFVSAATAPVPANPAAASANGRKNP